MRQEGVRVKSSVFDSEMKLDSCYISEYQRLLEEALNCNVVSDNPEELWGQVFVFPSDNPECDWNTDEMREISEKKAR